ncbi:hypothetical protein GC194_12365 [bacterium]|nr:hypothetical protein [bacterium]
MKQRLLTLTILLLVSSKSFCQFTDSDITITTKGLSEEYATRFTDSENKSAFVSILNQLNIPHDIAPIKLTVTYENGAGDVTAEIITTTTKYFPTHNTIHIIDNGVDGEQELVFTFKIKF